MKCSLCGMDAPAWAMKHGVCSLNAVMIASCRVRLKEMLDVAEKRAEDAVRSAKNAEAFIHLLDARAEQTRLALEEVAYQMDVTHVRRCVYCDERKRDPHAAGCVIGLALSQYIDAPHQSFPGSEINHDLRKMAK